MTADIKSIGIIGQGRFGKLLNEIFAASSLHIKVNVFSRKDSTDRLQQVAQSDLVIPAVPIREFETVVQSVVSHLSSDSVLMDVCSVKEHPVSIMKKFLPEGQTIVASHPLFGPATVHKIGIKGLKVVMSKVQGDSGKYMNVKKILKKIGLSVIEMSPEEHDKAAAKSQFVSHLLAHQIKGTKIFETPMSTRSTESLKEFFEMIQPDDQLLQDMYNYNRFARNELSHHKNIINDILLRFNLKG